MKNYTDSQQTNVLEEPEPAAEAEVRKDNAAAVIEDPENRGTWRMITDYREPGLRGVLNRLGRRIAACWNRLIHGKQVLTPAGKCFLNYCRAIVAGTQRPEERIYAYEEELSKLTALFKTKDGKVAKNVPREVLAQTVVYFMGNMETES